MGKILDIARWRQEIELAEKFKEDNFGKYDYKEHSRVGENVDYYDRGFSISGSTLNEGDMLTTLNLIHAIVKNIVPSLYYQNPKVMVFPRKVDSQDTAPIVGEILNYYFKELDIDEINQKIIWDAYVLGHGYCKIGYTTKYGTDIPQEEKKKTLVQKARELITGKREVEEIVHPELNYNIISGRPYVMYISPFDFGRDPRANTLEESMYWYHKVRRTVKYMKGNKKYKNTDKLVGVDPVDVKIDYQGMAQSEIEDFKTVELYEIHYRSENEVFLLCISCDGEGEYRSHYHEKSPYMIDGWQVEELTFNKHGHSPFAISDVTKIRNLQDRFTSTFEAILEQVDRFVPKLAYNGGDVTTEGKNALRDGDVGALVETTKDPNVIFKELNMTQLKADLKMLLEEIINVITIQTGLTRAQLTGMSNSGTATEAQIEQGGQTLRLSDMGKAVSRFSRRQSKKLWQIVRQFVELDELQLINGQTGIDEQGRPKYNWITIGTETSLRLQTGDYDFDIEVGSTQKPDLAVVRKQFENLFSILSRTDVITLMQQQGDKVVLSELLRMYLNLFPEAVKDIGRIVQKITPQTTGLVPPPVDQGGGTTQGSNFNALEAQAGQPAMNMPQLNQMGDMR